MRCFQSGSPLRCSCEGSTLRASVGAHEGHARARPRQREPERHFCAFFIMALWRWIDLRDAARDSSSPFTLRHRTASRCRADRRESRAVCAFCTTLWASLVNLAWPRGGRSGALAGRRRRLLSVGVFETIAWTPGRSDPVRKREFFEDDVTLGPAKRAPHCAKPL